MTFLKQWVSPVLVGFLTVVVLSMGTDAILQATGIFPPPTAYSAATWMLALALAYRTLFTVLGGYVAAWLSSVEPMKRVWTLAVLGQIGGILGVVAGWNLSAHWYPIAIAVLAIPSVWLGGWLKTRNESPAL